MQWLPVSRELLRALPTNRPYTKLEAAVKLTADLQDGITRSMREYGRIFQWDSKTAKLFIESGVIVNLNNSTYESRNNSMLKDDIPQALAKISHSAKAPHVFRKSSADDSNNDGMLQNVIPQILRTDSANNPQLYSRKNSKKEDPCHSSSSNALFNLWNDTAEGTPLSKVRELSSTRAKKCSARLKERSINEWAAIFRQIADTPFLCGAKGWKATFDWIIANDGNAAKVLEGTYEDRTASISKPSDNRYADIFAGA
ncbi:MAG: hypothetical protein LWW87_08475 [Geobacteraceae bacterium]|nr:hypothetical protein [Geobacteraceae bacterium]